MVKTIIIADGETHVRKALRLRLEQEGFDVAGEADHVESLLAKVCTQPPNLLLLDWRLPGLRPHHLMKTLREHCAETMVVCMSVRVEDEGQSLSCGADAFIPKNLAPKQFLKALCKLTGSGKPIRATEYQTEPINHPDQMTR